MNVDATVWVGVLGVVVTLLTSLFKLEHWSNKVKNGICVGLSVVGAVVAAGFVNGWPQLDVQHVVTFATLVYGTAQAMYQFILRGTDAEAALANVNVAGGN